MTNRSPHFTCQTKHEKSMILEILAITSQHCQCLPSLISDVHVPTWYPTANEAWDILKQADLGSSVTPRCCAARKEWSKPLASPFVVFVKIGRAAAQVVVMTRNSPHVRMLWSPYWLLWHVPTSRQADGLPLQPTPTSNRHQMYDISVLLPGQRKRAKTYSPDAWSWCGLKNALAVPWPLNPAQLCSPAMQLSYRLLPTPLHVS